MAQKKPKLPGASKLNRTAARIKMAAPVWNQRLAENVSVEKRAGEQAVGMQTITLGPAAGPARLGSD